MSKAKGVVRKAFEQVSTQGLGIAKDGKLRYPFTFNGDNVSDTLNAFGLPYARPGDFCAYALPSGRLTAGTVGRVLSEEFFNYASGGRSRSFRIQMLDGCIEHGHDYGVGVLTEAQAKEVRDYYVQQEKRPERIKHDFWR